MPTMTRHSLNKSAGLGLLILALSNFAFTAHAQNTTAQNCGDLQISIERLGPVRDQAIAGLCFTYEGADLLTYQLGTRISAIDLALSYFKSTKLRKMSRVYDDGGDTLTAIEWTVKLGGVCTEELMPSDETFLKANDTDPRIYGAFKTLEDHSWNTVEAYNAAIIIFPYLEEEIFDRAAKLNTFKDRIQFLQENACTERIAFDHLKLNYFEAVKRNEVPGLIKKIHRQLENNNVIGMGFRSNDLFSKQEEDDSDNHATTLVGRRWNPAKNQCEYLMRDNFGGQCGDTYQSHFECKGGYIWLDEKFLLKNMYEIEYY